MQKQNTLVKHNILGGWSFYPLTYKGQQYVITIVMDRLKNHQIDCYKYKKEWSLFTKHKGEKVFHTHHSCFFVKEKHVMVTSIFSEGFEKYYPQILKSIFEEFEEKETNFKQINANKQWNGVIE